MSIPKTSAGSGKILLWNKIIAEWWCGKREYDFDLVPSKWTILSRNWYYYWYFQNWRFYSYWNQTNYNWWFAYTQIEDDASEYNIITFEQFCNSWTIKSWNWRCATIICNTTPVMSWWNPSIWKWIWQCLPQQSASWYDANWWIYFCNEQPVVRRAWQYSSNTDYTLKSIIDINAKRVEHFVNWTSVWTWTISDSVINTFRQWWFNYVCMQWWDYAIHKSVKITLEK